MWTAGSARRCEAAAAYSNSEESVVAALNIVDLVSMS